MISAVLLQSEENVSCSLSQKLAQFCPQVNIQAHFSDLEQASKRIEQEKPQIVFFDLNESLSQALNKISYSSGFTCETIIFSPCKSQFLEAIKYCAIGFILKPVNVEELILTIRHAEKRIYAKEKWSQSQQHHAHAWSLNKVIGIPTMEGYEFVSIQDIIRCEGFQKCTRVIIKNHKNIVSSYNLGEFIRILKEFGFYSPHKSHVINLAEIVKYSRDGRVQLSDLSCVPVARRKRHEFLDLLLHI